MATSLDSVNIASPKGNFTFKITATDTWAITTNANLFTSDIYEGTSDATITVNYTENTTTIERSGSLMVSSGEEKKVIVITQGRGNAKLTVSPQTKTITAAKGSFDISITSNTNWEISTSEEWLIPDIRSDSGDKTIAIEYDINYSSDDRVGNITVKGGDISKSVKM